MMGRKRQEMRAASYLRADGHSLLGRRARDLENMGTGKGLRGAGGEGADAFKKINRRNFIRTTALGSAGIMLSARLTAQQPSAKAGRPPNLVVLLPDGHRPDTLACYGARRSITPNLDKLATQSVIFERAYVTQPICTPSRSSLMTG